jgi:hypothetical protein
MPNRRASAVVVPPGSPGAQQARFPGGSRSTEVCRGADAPPHTTARQYVRVPPKCDTWSVHRHASRLKSKEEPGVVLKKRNAARAEESTSSCPLRVNTNQPPTNHRKPSGARPSPPLTHVRRPPLEAYHRPRRSREPPLGRAQGVGPRRLRQSEPTHPSGSPAARGPLAPTRREALPGCVSHLSTT